MSGKHDGPRVVEMSKFGTVVGDGDIRVRYEDPKMYVTIPCSPEQTVTVILALQEEQGVKSLLSTATWSEADDVAIAEFEVVDLGEKYEIYVDIQ